MLSVGEYAAAAGDGAAVGRPALRRRLVGRFHLVDQRRVAGLPAVPGGRAGVLPAAQPAGRGARGVLAVAAMSPMAWAYLSTGSPYFDWSWLVRILSGFGAGVLAYLAVRRLRASGAAASRPGAPAASVLAAALPVLIAAGLLAGELLGPGRGGAVIVLFPLLVGALAVADRGPGAGAVRALGGVRRAHLLLPVPGAHPDAGAVLARPAHGRRAGSAHLARPT